MCDTPLIQCCWGGAPPPLVGRVVHDVVEVAPDAMVSAAALGGGLILILRVLSAAVMSRALIRPFPVPSGAVS
jgi:hypothetical protein